MKILVEIEIQDNDQIEEGSDWPAHLERYKDSGKIPQQVRSVKILKNYIIGPIGNDATQELEQELSNNHHSIAYEWHVFSGTDLKLSLIQEEV